MKIRVHDSDEGRNIRLALPTSLIKSNFIWRLIKKKAKAEELDNIISYERFCKTGYKALREYIKENGHFTLVEVHTNDGDEVVILV